MPRLLLSLSPLFVFKLDREVLSIIPLILCHWYHLITSYLPIFYTFLTGEKIEYPTELFTLKHYFPKLDHPIDLSFYPAWYSFFAIDLFSPMLLAPIFDQNNRPLFLGPSPWLHKSIDPLSI